MVIDPLNLSLHQERYPTIMIASIHNQNEDLIYATDAAYNIALAAQRMGLGNCLIGYFIYALENSVQLRKRLGLTDSRRVDVALVIGYPKYQFRRTVPRRKTEIIWNPAVDKAGF